MYRDHGTYFLCGLYLTYKMYKDVRGDPVLEELRERWANNPNDPEFSEYFNNWDTDERKMGLCSNS